MPFHHRVSAIVISPECQRESKMPASQQPASLRNMSPSKSPAMIAIHSHGSQSGLSEGGEDGTFSLTRPESFPHMSSASTDGGGSAQSIAAFQDEPGESDDESGDSGDDEDLLSAYQEQLAVLAQGKPPERSRPRAGRGSGCAALVSAAAGGVDAQWKVVSAATAELKAHWAAAEALQAPQQPAPQQPALVPVDSDKHLKAVLAAAVPQLRAHWAAPQAVPKAYTAAEDQHLKAVVDRAVTEIKAHWAAAEAPAPEASTPCRKQILSSEKDFAAVVSVLVAEAQAHWAIDESR